jgi:hypothetical protein
MNESARVFPARWALGSGGGGRTRDVWAVVTDKWSLFGANDVRARYTCQEIEWLEDGTWQEKAGGRTFTHCYEASTASNANIHRTRTNVVHLFRVSTVAESSSSESSAGAAVESSSSSSSSGNVVDDVYIFDKCLGNVLRPASV